MRGQQNIKIRVMSEVLNIKVEEVEDMPQYGDIRSAFKI